MRNNARLRVYKCVVVRRESRILLLFFVRLEYYSARASAGQTSTTTLERPGPRRGKRYEKQLYIGVRIHLKKRTSVLS